MFAVRNIVPLLFILVILLGAVSCAKDDPDPVITDPDPVVAGFEPPATRNIIMYEVNQRAFSSSGDLQGVTGGLDHIESLHVNVIWLMPIHPIGEINSVNSPYSVKNYKEVNPDYGTMANLIELVDAAHDKGMAVILDWVANHTAWDNPWIENTDWYTQDGNGNIVHPPGTNWQDVADLNFDNQEMRLAMIDAMKFWIDTAGIDGFRCDAADWVPFDFWEQAIDSLNGHSGKDLILLAEGARDDHFDAGFDLNFGWEYYGDLKAVFNDNENPGQFMQDYVSDLSGLPDDQTRLIFTTNHDESAWDATPVVIFNGEAGATAASVITTFLPGVPMIYNGQEVGVEDNIMFFSNDPIDWSQNPDMLDDYQQLLGFYASSETAREGNFQKYNHSDIASFTLTSGENTVLVMVNTRDVQVDYTLPDALGNRAWTNVLSGDTITLGDSYTFEGYGYLVLEE